jgi:LPS-assembly protein
MRVRRSAATAALVTFALGLPARPQVGGPGSLLAGPPGQEVDIEADRILYAWESQVLYLEGHVVARRGGGIMRAAKGKLDRARGLLSLEGGVLGVQGHDVLLADSALIDLRARSAEMHSAVLYLKERLANPDNPKSGRNTLILHGSRLRQLPDGYTAENVTITPCDCEGDPDYELLAGSARLEGDRAHLSGVRLHIRGPPIPLFPLSLPLTERQWGLLQPTFGIGGPVGFAYAQPVFFTLGRSNDSTITPGWFTGGSNPHHLSDWTNRTVRGPRFGLEWRYAPVAGTLGAIGLDLFDDLDAHDSPAQAPPAAGEPGTSPGRGFGGVRGVAHLAHRSEGVGGVFAVQGTIASDNMVVVDAEPATLERYLDFLSTDVGAWKASGPLTLGADATLLQDVRITDYGFPDRRLFGAERRATFQRLPALFAQLAPVFVGPATFSAEASAVQYASFAQPDALERTTGFAPTDHASGPPLDVGNAARGPATRLDLAPRLAFAGPADLPLDLRLQLGARFDGYLVEGFSQRNRARAYAIAGASAALPLERRFGPVLHRIEPAIEVRAISSELHTGGPPIGDPVDGGGAVYTAAPNDAQQGLAVPAMRRPYDEIDGAAPSTGAIVTTLSVSQSFWRKGGRVPARVARLDLLQDAVLWAGRSQTRLGQGGAKASVQLGPVGLGGGLLYDWAQRAISAATASAGVHDDRGDEVHASTLLLRGSSSERIRAGIDELFSVARFSGPPGDLSGSANAGASAPLPFGLRLKYDAIRALGPLPPGAWDWVHTTTLAYETPCRCAALSVRADLEFREGKRLPGYPRFFFVLDLKSLGSFATN